MFNTFYKFLSFKLEKFNSVYVFFRAKKNYYFLLHCRLATNFSTFQLADVFTYELFLKKLKQGEFAHKNFTGTANIVVYNLHNLNFNTRLYVFNQVLQTPTTSSSLSTVSELFTNANWLEREVSELHGLQFTSKKDLRNLMLQYGDTSAPFKKAFPTAGFRETLYDVVTDSVVQTRIDVQN